MSNTVEVDTRCECPTCGETFSHYPSQRKRRYCSKKCWYASKRQERQGVGELGRFLHDHWQKSGLSLQALARQIGISSPALDDLIGARKTPTQHTRNKLKEAFGEGVPLPPDLGAHTCPICKKPFRKPAVHQVYCSQACFAEKRKNRFSPRTRFARFLLDDWDNSKLTLAAWSSTVGLPPGTLNGLMRGALPMPRTLDRLRAKYGDRLPATETAKYEHRVQILLANQEKGHTPEAREKAAKSMRGRKRKRASVAKWMATRRANGSYDRTLAILAVSSRSDRGRCRASLLGRLRGNPKPSRALQKEWAEEAARTFRISPKEVLAIWEPYLEKRELIPRSGRPEDPKKQEKLRVIEEGRANAPKTASGRVTREGWKKITCDVSVIEGREMSVPEVQKFYWENRES